MQLFGRTWTRRDIEARTGRFEQLAGVRRLICAEGPESGGEVIEVRTGAGLSFDVHPGRGLDIGRCELGGIPLGWQSGNGAVRTVDGNPGTEFVRSTAGGLLFTCGLEHVGQPDEHRGLHGRVSHIPARQVVAEGRWHGDEHDLRIAGVVTEAALFGQHLQLTREIACRVGENRIRITDTIENLGGTAADLMLLYHVNFGWPLLGPATRLTMPGRGPQPREPGTPTPGWDGWQAPDPQHAERVYYHGPLAGERAQAVVANPELGVSVSLSWDPRRLPELVQWRMPGHGAHVLGIEPATCRVAGHAAERAAGRVIALAPGAAWTSTLELDVNRL
jgi:hypothetical protein